MHDRVFAREIKTVVNNKLNSLSKGANLIAINVKLSPLSHVKPEGLREAFALMVKGSRLEGIPLNIDMSTIEVKCHSCSKIFLVSGPTISCPGCNCRDLEVKYGPEFFVESIKIDGQLHNEK